MISPPKPGQALDLYLGWPPSVTEQPCGGYELRCVSYVHLVCRTPARINSGLTANEIGELLRAIRHTESYDDLGIGCEMRDWEDRANKEDCWRDWWKADWVKEWWSKGLGPDPDYEGCPECDPFGDSFECVCI